MSSRRISSKATLLYKMHGYAIGLAVCLVYAQEAPQATTAVRLYMALWCLLWFVGGYLAYGRAKSIFLDGEYLVVESWSGSTRIPLKAFVGMSRSVLIPNRAWLELGTPGALGRFVHFVVPYRVFYIPFSTHPNEDLLRGRILEARADRVPRPAQWRSSLKHWSSEDLVMPSLIGVMILCALAWPYVDSLGK